MGNFARALRLAFRYRWTFGGTVACALIVAVLWGGNIGVVYPLVEVCVSKKTLSQWVNEKIASAESESQNFRRSIEQLSAAQANAAPAEQAALESQIATARFRLDAEQAALERYEWIKPPIEAYLPNDSFQTLVVIIVALLIGTVVKDFFLTLNSILVDRLSNLTALELRKQFFRRTLRMDLASFGESGTSELLSRFTYDMDGVTNGVQTFFGRAIREPLKAVACLAGAAWICWRLLLLSLIVAPVAAWLISILAKTLKRANRKAMETMSSLYSILVEVFSGIKVVKGFAMEPHERQRFHQISKQCYRKAMRIAVLDAMVNPVTELMGMITISLAIVFGAYLAMFQRTDIWGIPISSRPLDLGSLVMFYGMLAGVSDPARKLSEVFNRLQRAAAASDRVYQLLDREPTITSPPAARALPRHHRDIAFNGVTFHYHPSQTVLEKVDLRIAFGETVAIVGPNGCGKSTLANLLPRFFDPISGSVKIDGVDIREVRLRDLRNQIGLVTQDTVLFDDTVLNNIRYGAPSATREQVMDAARQAHAHKFIEQRLDHGYETLVGAQGGRLSGGQRQRIALARAILRDPAILILDEATSQIDLESEQLIHKVLEQFTRNRTAIMITHRLSTLALADRIVVMHAGRIVDAGTHQQLLARCDEYRRLYQIQLKETA